MARKKKAPPTLEDMEPRCGSCRFWRAWEGADEPVGRCMFNPPQVVADGEGDCFTSWPTLEAGDLACGQFKAKN